MKKKPEAEKGVKMIIIHFILLEIPGKKLRKLNQSTIPKLLSLLDTGVYVLRCQVALFQSFLSFFFFVCVRLVQRLDSLRLPF